ncbi:unnamed protein product [Hymenolepis diminuta]|uniref:Uncharacterized protein n=1 Tax=Hymenolepis diminuta TaxID=6216 RepID=A0A0R3S841_HYMDI|nr:unnamed protein product [Hymenolepis diminuta]
MPILRRTSLWSRLPYRRRRHQNRDDNGYKGGFYRESSTNSSTGQNQNNKRVLKSTPAPISNAMRLYVSMRCEVTFLKKAIFKECYVTDRNIIQSGGPRLDG